MAISDEFADKLVEWQVDLQRLSESERDRILVILKDLEADIEKQIRKADVTGVQRTTFQIKRQERLLTRVKAMIATAMKSADKTLKNELLEVADIANQRMDQIFEEVLEAELAGVITQRSELRQLARDTVVQGAPAADWWAKQADDTFHRFATQIRIGVAAGESNAALIERIVGSKTGRKRVVEVDGVKRIFDETTGGTMQVTRRQAEDLVRTSVNSIGNNTLNQIYDDNSDVLKGKQALATLDGRTTDICRARSGAAWDMQGNPLPESPRQEPFPGPPPWHFNCRTVLIPITKSWQELLDEAGSPIKLQEEVPPSTRASMDGQVAADLKYDDWLKTKPVAFQREVLGPGKFELWKKGKITMPELIDQSGNPLTLQQLRDKVARREAQRKRSR